MKHRTTLSPSRFAFNDLGFTLIELMVVIGLISVVALFSGRQLLHKHSETRAMRLVSDILTVAVAAQADYVNRGQWQGQSDDQPCESLFESLDNIRFANIDLNQDLDESAYYDFSCPDVAGRHPMLEITWEMPNQTIQQIVHQNLPLSAIEVDNVSLDAEGQDSSGNSLTVYQVRHYVVAPSANRHSIGIHLGRERIRGGTAGFDLDRACGRGLDAEVLSESISGFCSSESVSGYSLIQENGESGDRSLYVYEINESGGSQWAVSSDICNGKPIEISILYRCVPHS